VATAAASETTALFAALRSGADALCRLAEEGRLSEEGARALADEVASAFALDGDVVRAELCSRTLGDARIPALPPRLAVETVVRLLAALAPVRGASLWASGRDCLSAAGRTSAEARSLATAELAGRAGHGGAVTAPVRSWGRTAAALVLEAQPSADALCRDLAREAAGALALVLEREALLDRNRERERSLVEAGERRLARLAFDIHDGPIQIVAALGLELRLLGDGSDAPGRDRALRELHERLAALEEELRELTQTLEPTSIARRPLDASLAGQAEAFGRQHGITVSVETAGDLEGLTPSQRIALVRVVHEALANARDHGGATDVRVAVRGDRRGVTARVTDNGCGFDVASALAAAARKGRLGLVGMSERVRLLGGRLEVESRPGGPTTIEAYLERWSPPAAASAPTAAASAAGAVPAPA
jgi:signal transduction histidine kinase